MNHVYQASKWIFPDETAEKSENRGGQLGHRATWEKNEKFTPRVIYGGEHDARRKIGRIDLKDTFPKMALLKSQKTPKKRCLAPLRRRFRQIFSKSWEILAITLNIDPCENEKNRVKQSDLTKNRGEFLAAEYWGLRGHPLQCKFFSQNNSSSYLPGRNLITRRLNGSQPTNNRRGP